MELPIAKALNNLRRTVREIIEALLLVKKPKDVKLFVKLLMEFGSLVIEHVCPITFHETLAELLRMFYFYLKVQYFEAYDQTDSKNGPALDETKKRFQTYIE